MVGLLKQGKSVQEVSEWLDVIPEFVEKKAAELGLLACPAKGKTKKV